MKAVGLCVIQYQSSKLLSFTVPFETTVLGSPEEIWGFELPVRYSRNCSPRLA